MFFDQEKINNLLKCGYCEKNYDYNAINYSTPTCIPCCGTIICHSCLESIESSKKNNNYTCVKCSKQFMKPSNGFLVSKLKESLFNMSPVKITRGYEVDLIINKHEKLLKSCDELKHILLNGKDIVTEMRFNLINSIQLTKEKAIIEIEDQHKILIKKIETFQFNLNKNNQLLDQDSVKKIKEFSTKVLETIAAQEEYLYCASLDVEKINQFKSEINNLSLQASIEINKIKSFYFQNSEMIFTFNNDEWPLGFLCERKKDFKVNIEIFIDIIIKIYVILLYKINSNFSLRLLKLHT